MADEAKAGEPGRAKQPGSGKMTWLWMVLALVVVGGFLVWLGAASEPSSVAVVETEEEEEEALEEGVTVVQKDSLADDKARWVGQRIQVPRLEATGELGPAIFWGELGDQTEQVPILVRLDSAAASGWQMQDGALYTVTGEVHPMSDSVANAWGEAGEFTGEGEQLQAAFTDYYIQATRIRQARGGGSGGGADADGGSDETRN